MNSMLAGRFHLDSKKFCVEEVPVPVPGSGEVLIEVKAAGVCLSDLHLIDGSLSPFSLALRMQTFTFAEEDGVKFVQHRVWKDRADIAKLFLEGAVVYVCGDGQRMAPAVRDTLARIYSEGTGMTHEEALRTVEQIERERGRFVEDVFA